LGLNILRRECGKRIRRRVENVNTGKRNTKCSVIG
jgi:hypothetical protein